ncbi:MAG: ammonia-forming cytochrome c nitrite reductase subunit c552 [Candidatus Bipolaricaulia bacterium]
MKKALSYGLIALVLGGVLGGIIYYYFASRRVPGAPSAQPPAVTKPAPTPPLSLSENTCVTCHRGLTVAVGHTFADWEGSSHARAGVACQDCHGGDATKSQVEQAHQGVRSSRDPESPLYFTRLPQTCGSCHSAEWQLFQQSVHYAQLRESGRGPNCVTCHGAMATTVLQPTELATTCSACHNPRLASRPEEPIKARFALTLMTHVQEYLDVVENVIAMRQGQIDLSQAEALLAQARQALQRARQEWHLFMIDRVEEKLHEAMEQARAALAAARP